MNRVLIIYPELFKCYEKFSRKVAKIVQNLDDTCLVYSDDANGFITKLSKEKSLKNEIDHDIQSNLETITHAIVFDDGEVFSEEIEKINSNGIPLRVIRVLLTRVINIKKETEYQSVKSTPNYEYIGRGSYWGNPYSMYDEGDDREEVIRKFKYDFDYDKFPNKEKSEVYKLAGKRLGCFCKPQSCHGDVLADFLNAWDDGK